MTALDTHSRQAAEGVRPPSLRECFAFPLSTPASRRDLVIGGALLVTLPLGWLLNLGHRLDVVHRVVHGDAPYFRGFSPWSRTLSRGARAFTAIAVYLTPSVLAGACAALAWRSGARASVAALAVFAALLFVLAVFSLPGGMTYNAAFDDMSYLYRPDKAFARAVAGGRAYLRAWGIALCAIGLTPLGLLALGLGFFFTSVWAWSVVGYAFSRALVLADPTVRARSR